MGQFPSIRRNMNNIIVVLDLSAPASLGFIAGPIPTIIGRSLPFRWGVVAGVESESGTSVHFNFRRDGGGLWSWRRFVARKMARLFYFATRRYGRKKVIEMCKQVRPVFGSIYLR